MQSKIIDSVRNLHVLMLLPTVGREGSMRRERLVPRYNVLEQDIQQLHCFLRHELDKF